MVELVDTRDLKSLDQKWLCGFESRSRHNFTAEGNVPKRRTNTASGTNTITICRKKTTYLCQPHH